MGSLCVTSAKPLDLFTPLHPDRVIDVRFRTFAALEKPLRDVLDRSLLEPHNDRATLRRSRHQAGATRCTMGSSASGKPAC